MDGGFTGKLLLCLQETNGRLGPRVLQSLDVPENIYLVASKSGKFDKRLMQKWVEDCIQPMTSDRQIMLLYDSWTGQTYDEIYSSLGENCIREQIPPKATSLVQPLDKYIFRQYKIFRRKIFERVVLDGLDLDLHKRENIIKLHSLIFNQFQSKSFTPMFNYSWYACTYTTEKEFKNVNQLLFSSQDINCESDFCQSETFIKCAHCNLNFCFQHFYVQNHYHSIDVHEEGQSEDLLLST